MFRLGWFSCLQEVETFVFSPTSYTLADPMKIRPINDVKFPGNGSTGKPGGGRKRGASESKNDSAKSGTAATTAVTAAGRQKRVKTDAPLS